MTNRRCKQTDCNFTATGALTATAINGDQIRFGVCAVHRDEYADDLISNPNVTTVQWEPRDTWSLDGASA